MNIESFSELQWGQNPLDPHTLSENRRHFQRMTGEQKESLWLVFKMGVARPWKRESPFQPSTQGWSGGELNGSTGNVIVAEVPAGLFRLQNATFSGIAWL